PFIISATGVRSGSSDLLINRWSRSADSLPAAALTSFSVKPIKIITVLGAVVCAGSVVGLIYSLVSHLCGNTVPGWTSMMMSIWLLGGIQLLSLGIIGEYVGKIYSETKARPRFIIDTYLKD
ncbi:MAG: hypothetical protein RSE36_04515, partial [Oscillospiraceae bacterium]